MSGAVGSQDDFPKWYQSVLSLAEVAENGPVRGTMVIRPYGYAIWELIVAAMDSAIKGAGAENCYFPLFIPQSYLQREAEHVEGFNPELAIVTHAGGRELEEPIVVRPTSETVIGEYMAKWIESYRDLPLLLNQWANVVRWELRPRMFLRNTEFLWQEGHTAHQTQDDAARYVQRIVHEVYRDTHVGALALPVLVGRKIPSERFPGAVESYSCEGIMRDGKALQVGTIHELGQNFSRPFKITFSDADGRENYAWTTSWGTSTRMMGAVIMTHGDEDGLRLPPAIAPHQVVVMAIKEDAGVVEAVEHLGGELRQLGVRVRLDMRFEKSFGRRATEWTIKGVPLRVAIGPRDLANGQCELSRRDRSGRESAVLAGVAVSVPSLLTEIQDELLRQAKERLADGTHEASSIDEIIDICRSGVARVPSGLVTEEVLAKLGTQAITVRCLQRRDGGVATPQDAVEDVQAIIARAY